MRFLRVSCVVLFLLLLSAVPLMAQAPQLARDYVYGPGGRLAVTIEPDNYPPSPPSGCTASGGPCAINGIDVSWGPSPGDIGSGISGYNGPGGFTTGFSYHDSNVQGGQCYTYYVSTLDKAGLESDLIASNTYCIDICIDEYEALFVKLPQLPRSKRQSSTVHARLLTLGDGVELRRKVVPWIKLVEGPRPIGAQVRLTRAPRQLLPPSPPVTVAAGGGE